MRKQRNAERNEMRKEMKEKTLAMLKSTPSANSTPSTLTYEEQVKQWNERRKQRAEDFEEKQRIARAQAQLLEKALDLKREKLISDKTKARDEARKAKEVLMGKKIESMKGRSKKAFENMTEQLKEQSKKDRAELTNISEKYKKEIYDLVEGLTAKAKARREAAEAGLANPKTGWATEFKPSKADIKEKSEQDTKGKKEKPPTPPSVEQL